MPDAEGRFRLGVVGSRDFAPDDEIFAAVERMVARHPEGVVVFVKFEKGVAEAAWQNAALLNLPYEILHEADDGTLGSKVAAGSELNGRLVATIDTLIAFFHPGPRSDLNLTSSGTVNAINQAKGAKVPIFAFHEGKWTVGDMPKAPELPPDGWTIPRGYRGTATVTSTCGNTRRVGCGAEILWSESPRGSKVPLNRDGTSHLDTCHVRAKEARQHG